ncbi:MAG TPA: hypothetical protein VKT29_10605 [Terriglobales bacterium]|nr:hypothetical protein [Terriglobales bacterium]
MRNVYEVLQEKERQVELLRRQIAALRAAIPLLVEDSPGVRARSRKESSSPEQVLQWKEALQVVAPLLADETDDLVPALRARRVESAKRKKAFLSLR